MGPSGREGDPGNLAGLKLRGNDRAICLVGVEGGGPSGGLVVDGGTSPGVPWLSIVDILMLLKWV
jgi:hypothetical protein